MVRAGNETWTVKVAGNAEVRGPSFVALPHATAVPTSKKYTQHTTSRIRTNEDRQNATTTSTSR